jgi:hypothetical protein
LKAAGSTADWGISPRKRANLRNRELKKASEARLSGRERSLQGSRQGDEPMRFLNTEHQVMAELLKQLTGLLEKPDVLWAFEVLDFFWASLAVHIRAEHVCLFPAILNAPRDRFAPADGAPSYTEAVAMVARLRSDHTEFMNDLAQAIKLMREILDHPDETDQARIDAVKEFIAHLTLRLGLHAELEEDRIYKWARILLMPPEFNELEKAVRHEIETLPGRFAGAI